MSKFSLLVRQRRHEMGVTLVEVLASLAVGASLSMMMVQLLGNLSEDQMGASLRRHHQVLADAAATYVEKNWLALQDRFDSEGLSELRLPLTTYQANSGLPAGWRDINPMGQSSCLIVHREVVNSQNLLRAVLITQGGRAMPLTTLWPAGMVQKHGVGILDADRSTQRVRAIGFKAQWEVRQKVDGGLLSGLDCTSEPLASGRLATLLSLRSPSQLTNAQTIMRKDANSSLLTTVAGGLSLPDPTQGQTLLLGSTATKTSGDACTTIDDGKLAATTEGKVLVCQQVDSSTRQWTAAPANQGAVASAMNTISADQVVIDGLITENTPCFRLGEMARVADGALAYCARTNPSDAPSAWKWRKVGGKWKYVVSNGATRSTINPEPWATPSSLASLGIPSTARVAQVSVFAQSYDAPVTIKMNGISVAKTCCNRDLGVSLLMPNGETTLSFSEQEGINPLNKSTSALWIFPQGYIDDDPN